jgi:hypothetical protein
MKEIAVIVALTFVVTLVAHSDRALAYTTFITHEDQAVGGCGGHDQFSNAYTARQ